MNACGKSPRWCSTHCWWPLLLRLLMLLVSLFICFHIVTSKLQSSIPTLYETTVEPGRHRCHCALYQSTTTTVFTVVMNAEGSARVRLFHIENFRGSRPFAQHRHLRGRNASKRSGTIDDDCQKQSRFGFDWRLRGLVAVWNSGTALESSRVTAVSWTRLDSFCRRCSATHLINSVHRTSVNPGSETT